LGSRFRFWVLGFWFSDSGVRGVRFDGMDCRIPELDFVFRVWCFEFPVSRFAVRSSGSKTRNSNFWSQIAGFGFRVSGFGSRVLGFTPGVWSAR